MSQYLAPGVFVEEVDFQPSQIQPASTSVAAMVGPARFGPVSGPPPMLGSFADFQNTYGDMSELVFGDAGTVTNYSAYAARAFFDNGGQQLYFVRVVNQAAPAVAASLAVPSSSPVVIFGARSPGAGGNLDLVFAPRRSPRLLQFTTPKPTDTVLLKLTNPPISALTGAALPAGVTGIASLMATATLAAGPPAVYDFVPGQSVIYIDQSGNQHVSPLANFATGIAATAVPATGPSAPLTASVQAMPGIGTAPLYSIPVGVNITKLLALPSGVLTLYGTVSGPTVTLPKAVNPALSADTQIPLALLGMGSRTGDGNIYHDAYDITVLNNGASIYSFSAVTLEQSNPPANPTNDLATAMAQNPVSGTAQILQPVYASYVGTPSVTALWADLLAAFDPALMAPANPAMAPSYVLHLNKGTAGTDGNAPDAADYTGLAEVLNGVDVSTGLGALEAIDQVSIVLCPAAAIDPANHQAVVSAMQAHCTKMLYRVAVIDSPKGAAVGDVQQFASQFSDTRLALYYPWVSATYFGAAGGQVLLPPSGFVAGLYAYTDITRGVHKAPANVVIQDALGLELSINTAQQDLLNPLGINCLRQFTWGGYRVWGARTLSSDPQWQYVNVRRYFLYLEHSLANSTSWVVFEPNGQALWAAVATTVSDFLYNEWREGRLFGSTPAEAFFVRCDQTTMTLADIEDGRLICVIGVAPLEPAEFVIFRIGQYTASAT